jgi:hypothetical protein
MATFELKTHRPGRTYSEAHFFILNKGLNSGKPLGNPCPNCFVLKTKKENLDNIKSICWILFETNKYKPLLRGSVIDFVVINEVKKLISYQYLKTDSEHLKAVTRKWKAAKKLELKFEQQLKLIKDYQKALLKTI